MGSRRRGREAALQALYQLDLNPGLTAEQALAHVFETFGRGEPQSGPVSVSPREALPDWDAEQRMFAGRLVAGVTEARERIDGILAQASTHWRLDRMAAVDRNLLRLAVHELLCEADIPTSVTIDEAVEIAKRYGTAESPAFVSGVLHRVATDIKERP